MQHLSAQDDELVKQTHMLVRLLQASGITLGQVFAMQGSGNPRADGLVKKNRETPSKVT